MMQIRVRQMGNVVILDLSGVIDVNSANLVEVIGQCIRDGFSDFLCNFEDVETVDYIGVSVVAVAYKEIVNNSGRIKFINVATPIKNMLSITGLDRIIEICMNEGLAINSFEEDKAIENIKKMQLRRRFKRMPLDLKVEIKNKTSGNLESPGVEMLNLSGVGAYIYGCSQFKLGDEVILKFKIPPDNEDIALDAKVVWLCDRQIQPQLYPGMGIAFQNLEKTAQEKLLAFIERNLSYLSPEE
ncbi:MAG: PilZ domain-containing protein [Candidatus Omnitrophota bacterium]